jgi:tetrahydromethanopterin S-methyltransferase subunit A
MLPDSLIFIIPVSYKNRNISPANLPAKSRGSNAHSAVEVLPLIIHNTVMNPTFRKVHSEIQRGMNLSRCRKCGCMKGTLENLMESLPKLKMKDARELLKNVKEWYSQLEPLEYPCFGCKYCIPPEAMTLLTKKYPSLASSTLSSCELTVSADSWPPVEGEYTVLNSGAPVAVSTLASVKLEEKLSKINPAGLCIVGKTETENIGIDKIVKNVISNPAISHLIVTGKDSEGHQSGKTLLSLWEKGVDRNMRVIGSRGRRPILKNVSRTEVNTFRKQVRITDMIGCENTRTLAKKIRELAPDAAAVGCAPSCGCHKPAAISQPLIPVIKPAVPSACGCGDVCIDEGNGSGQKPSKATARIRAKKHGKNVRLDKAGYFVILPSKKNGTILVEHYSYENKLLRKIEGKTGRDIYFTIIDNKWVSELSHAAYLGKELARAELSLKKGFKFVQDGA